MPLAPEDKKGEDKKVWGGAGGGMKAYHRRSFCDTRRNPKRRFVVGGNVGHVVALGMGC